MSTNQKGAIAEAQIIAAAIALDIPVLKPAVEGLRYDIVFDLGSRLVRTQCKWANRENDVVVVRGRTSRHTPHGYATTTYSTSEIDGIAAWCPGRASATSSRSPISTAGRACIFGLRRLETTRNYLYTGRPNTALGL